MIFLFGFVCLAELLLNAHGEPFGRLFDRVTVYKPTWKPTVIGVPAIKSVLTIGISFSILRFTIVNLPPQVSEILTPLNQGNLLSLGTPILRNFNLRLSSVRLNSSFIVIRSFRIILKSDSGQNWAF
jgi:hypothetical protein